MKKLLAWSKEEFSSLPWRKKRTLYRTLVSEIMLQQTTVPTVVHKFEPFLKKFPSIESLAKAREANVLKAWEGLGYYRRARNLHKAAIEIQKTYKGKIPSQYDQLVEIPGIGDYTANAIIAIGKNKSALAIDANIERVLARYFGVENKTAAELKKYFRKSFAADDLNLNLEKWGARDFHEAIMDLGRTYCQAKKADCLNCPLKQKCIAFENKNPLEIPVQKIKEREKIEVHLLRIIVTKKNELLLYQKNSSEWLTDQWELPTLNLNLAESSFSQYPRGEKKVVLRDVEFFKSAITKYQIRNNVLMMTQKEAKQILPSSYFKRMKFVEIREDLHLSTATKKALTLKKLHHSF